MHLSQVWNPLILTEILSMRIARDFFSNAEDLRYIDAGNPSTSTNSWLCFNLPGRYSPTLAGSIIAFQGQISCCKATVRRDASSRFQGSFPLRHFSSGECRLAFIQRGLFIQCQLS
jgi:hypothetical protein